MPTSGWQLYTTQSSLRLRPLRSTKRSSSKDQIIRIVRRLKLILRQTRGNKDILKRSNMKKVAALMLVLLSACSYFVYGQKRDERTGGGHYVYGDVRVREDPAAGVKAPTFNVLLYNEFGT